MMEVAVVEFELTGATANPALDAPRKFHQRAVSS